MRQPFLEAAAFAAALWLLGAAAQAQDVPSPTPTPAPSPTPAPTRTPAALALPSARDEVDRQRRMDGAFMTRARLRGLEEIKLGQIVAQRSANDGVRSLARQIIEERGKANESLRLFAQSQAVELPTTLESARRAEVDRISKLPAAEIDHAYLLAMIRIHDEDVADFQKQTEAGQEVELQGWVYDTVPRLEEEQREIHRVAAGLGIEVRGTK